MPPIKGFILLKKYPGCSKEIGYFEPYTTGEFSNYPDFWKPVYKNEYKETEEISKESTSGIRIGISKNYYGGLIIFCKEASKGIYEYYMGIEGIPFYTTPNCETIPKHVFEVLLDWAIREQHPQIKR